jgi:hypothetical protein
MTVERPVHAMRVALAGAICAVLLSVVACEAPEPRAATASATGTPARPDASGVAPSSTAAALPGEGPRPIAPGACVRAGAALGDGWSIAPLGEDLVPLEARAISALSPRDSARLAARLARAVDALPSDTSVADFSGLPVVVRDAWSVVPAPGDTIFVAFVERRLPMESNPLEEAFALVAVPGARQGVRDPLIEQWYVRGVGREEALDPRDFVATVVRPEARVSLLFVRERAAGVTLEVVTRTEGRWALEWSGPIARCG